MANFVMILGALTALSGIGTIAGLANPRLVLWWAVPEKQTKGRAVCFAGACIAKVSCQIAWLWT